MSVTDETQPFIESPSRRQQLHWRKKNHIWISPLSTHSNNTFFHSNESNVLHCSQYLYVMVLKKKAIFFLHYRWFSYLTSHGSIYIVVLGKIKSSTLSHENKIWSLSISIYYKNYWWNSFSAFIISKISRLIMRYLKASASKMQFKPIVFLSFRCNEKKRRDRKRET